MTIDRSSGTTDGDADGKTSATPSGATAEGTEASPESPDLKLVSKSSSGSSSPSSSSSSPESARAARSAADETSSRSGWPIWAFIALFVFFSLALGWQFRVAGQLEAEIASLEGELAATTLLLGAHQERLVEIRSGVRELTAHLDGLRALVEAEPADSLPDSTRTESSTSTRAREHEIPARLPR